MPYPDPVHYLPLATTAVAAIFFVILLHRYLVRGHGLHLLWWTIGVFCYGLGTALEGAITLNGNTIALTKAWYVAGALLGGYPLAQGTVYLLLKRKTAHLLTALTLPFILIVATLVILSPVNHEAFLPHKPGGAVIVWSWLRLMTPIINLYAVIFLIGGAAWSAARYAGKVDSGHRALGNTLIALGAILPGIGGGMAKAGMVEALYVGEFIGLLFIWAGYAACIRAPVLVPVLPLPTAAAAGQDLS